MVDGFFCLWHHTVIGSHHQHHDIRHFRAARAHPRERFVAWRVHKNHAAIVYHDFVRADVLRDSAGFACRHFRLANRVQQARFPVVYVSHHRHYWRTRLQTLFGLFFRNFQDHFFFE